MKRRNFLKLVGLAPMLYPFDTLANNIEVQTQLKDAKALASEIPLKWKIRNEDPQTVDELTEAMERYTIPGGEYDRGYIDIKGERSHFMTFGLQAIKSDDSEKKIVKALWISFAQMIGDGKQTLYWRRKPHILEEDRYGEVFQALRTRIYLYPYHRESNSIEQSASYKAEGARFNSL